MLFLCHLNFAQSQAQEEVYLAEIDLKVALSVEQKQAERQLRSLWAEAEWFETPPEKAWQAELETWEAAWRYLSRAKAAQELAAFEQAVEHSQPSALEAWIEAEAGAITQEEMPPHFSPIN